MLRFKIMCCKFNRFCQCYMRTTGLSCFMYEYSLLNIDACITKRINRERSKIYMCVLIYMSEYYHFCLFTIFIVGVRDDMQFIIASSHRGLVEEAIYIQLSTRQLTVQYWVSHRNFVFCTFLWIIITSRSWVAHAYSANWTTSWPKRKFMKM